LSIKEASVDWVSGEPFSKKYKDLYFSKGKAIKEAEFVFIEGNNLKDRWSKLNKNDVFNIVELGFGAGINFLTTFKTWTERKNTNNWLNYFSIENHPLSIEDVKKILKNYKELSLFSDRFLKNYPLNCKGLQRIDFLKERVSLTLCYAEVSSCLEDLDPKKVTFDACFHDGFSPSKNEEMWSSEVFNYLALLSNDQATYSTFSSSKIVKERLKKSGFKVEISKGFGKKRHMIKAKFNKNIHRKKKLVKKNIAIIGAGIAGCTLAKILSGRGYKVTLFEKKKMFSSGPSSFQTLVMYPRLSAFDSSYSLFCLHSYLYSIRFYDSLNTHHWNKSGILLLDFNETTKKRFQQLVSSRNDSKIYRKVDREEASKISGVTLPYGGLFLKDAGWINPKGLCELMIKDHKINLINKEVKKVTKSKVFLEHKNYTFDYICLCSSYESKGLIDLKGITKKRGQVTYIKKEQELGCLKVPICAEGYISPSSKEELIIGSTYSEDSSNKIILQENLKNIEKLKLITNQTVKVLDSNFGYRSTTQDHLPLVGKSNEVFINICHGSRGVTTAPINAQYICDLIQGSPPVYGKKIDNSLDPERFN